MKKVYFILSFLLFFFVAKGGNLKPGFEKAEYVEMLKICAQTNQSAHIPQNFYPEKFVMHYKSPMLGLDDVWTLWLSEDSIAAIAIKGTGETSASWMANLYAAMVPARGEIQLTGTDTFRYELAQSPFAAVHIGWLVATGFLSKDILPHIDSCYARGIKNFYITGHSQGAGISFLLTSHLRNLQMKGELPQDITFKTYCSAGPKPGNLFYAYEYEVQTQDGWAYNVINSNDIVPMLPFTVQTSQDVLATTSFESMKTLIKEQELPHNLLLSLIYKRMDEPSQKAVDQYQKYLGEKMANIIKKYLEECDFPEYAPSNNYVRVGHQYILSGNENYYQKFTQNTDSMFIHHSPEAYYFILNDNRE